jgi:hypothetical protein
MNEMLNRLLPILVSTKKGSIMIQICLESVYLASAGYAL